MMIAADRLDFWFHESVSCLHDGMAVALRYFGEDPIEILGARWSFFHDYSSISQEEFYYPSPTGCLGRDLAPFHNLDAEWRQADDGDALLRDITAALAEGRPVLLVEDNYFMPNRPAFHDVHAAHLVLVTGYDEGTQNFRIMESTPPLYHGPISRAQLLCAVGSGNEVREASRDFFFAGSRLGFRWIDVKRPALTPEVDRLWATKVLKANVGDFRRGSQEDGQLRGLSGLQSYLDGFVADGRRGEEIAKRRLAEIYIVGWAHLAQCALHAEYLRRLGSAFDNAELRIAARRVDSVAAHWTAFRLHGAHGAHGDLPVETAVEEIGRRVGQFVVSHERAIDAIDIASASLRPSDRA